MSKQAADQPKHRPAWTRIYGQGGTYTVQQGGQRSYRVVLTGSPQPSCTCGAGSKAGQPAECQHIIALRDCGFIAA